MNTCSQETVGCWAQKRSRLEWEKASGFQTAYVKLEDGPIWTMSEPLRRRLSRSVKLT